jgi:integrase/recombinase XerD
VIFIFIFVAWLWREYYRRLKTQQTNMATTATTAKFIDKRNEENKEKKRPVSIRVTFNRVKKYYPTKFRLTIDEYDRMMAERPRKELKDILQQLQSLEKKATGIIDKLPVFTFTEFEKAFVENRGASDSVNGAFDKYIQQLKEEGRIGSAVAYEVTKTSLNKFCVENKMLIRTFPVINPETGKPVIMIDEKTGEEKEKKKYISNYTFSYITPAFLKKYEKWMLDQGNSTTTIGIYLRSLRAIINIAINDGLITKDFYPFGKRRYEIPASKNTKKALSLSDIGKIYNYQPLPGSTSERMRDYWLFLYFCNGMNVKDFSRLRYKNIQDDFLVFHRAKTERTKRVSQEIRIPLHDDINAIIKKYGNKKINDEAYIFPVLQPAITLVRERDLVKLLTRLINDHIKKIAEAVGIKANVTTYVARHSFASVLKRSGASVEFISEAMAHGHISTTQNYLASFEDDMKKEVAKALTAFKNVG